MARLDHITQPVRDWREARDWWTSHLGFQVEFELEGGVAVKDEADLTLFLVEGPVLPTLDKDFNELVDDEKKRCAAIGVAGAPIVHPPQSVFWGYGAEVLDPNGYRIRLWDVASMQSKGAA